VLTETATLFAAVADDHRICSIACTRPLAFVLLLRTSLVPSCNTVPAADMCMPVLLYLSVPLSFGPPAASFSHRLLLHGHASYLGSGCAGVRLVLLCVIALYGSRALPRRVLIRVAFLTGCSCMSPSCLGPSSFVKLPSVLFFCLSRRLIALSSSISITSPHGLFVSLRRLLSFLALLVVCACAPGLLRPPPIASCFAFYFVFATPRCSAPPTLFMGTLAVSH